LHDQRIDSRRANQPSPESPQSPTSVISPNTHAHEYSWSDAGGNPDPYRIMIGVNYRPPPGQRSRALDNFFARKYTLGILVANLVEHGLDETTGECS